MEFYLTHNVKTNQLLARLPADLAARPRATCQALFLGALRHGHRVRHALRNVTQHNPRKIIEAVLLVSGYEILSNPVEKYPQIIHYAVEHSKRFVRQSEVGLLNALLRKLPDTLDATHADNRPDVHFSHPRWLFRHWNKAFGLQQTIQLMKWNQAIPAVYIKFYKPPKTLPEGLVTTPWDHFYKLAENASWHETIQPLLNKGDVYVKDPSTRLAPDLLAPEKGDDVLDLCAAPGGKTYDLAYQMELEGHIVAVDLPGERMLRLQENLHTLKSPRLRCTPLEASLLELNGKCLADKQLPHSYDAVMLDAPCSNTGVIQRRTDVKWRIQPKDLKKCAALQQQLLKAAASFVKASGRLVYSTCSIEFDENQAVVDAFLRSSQGRRFSLQESRLSLPWETGHDGASAFLLVAD